ncbi:coiled-coil and C2 domain-containing protein 2A [Teleopsis dalmanni]|uniref:coiled-coil and C2 domain-containing protein 2A n=1 Tax=Teleopsis dalmanni TaxID=139649 RepID=UPI0018CFA65B|nr:coiled-coil and C2 domain-containing protein 2A [Teleopsis dalmanni]XP_037948080.1 coiled-coil and C2 domain-containing protein 2A [Teleopsis dalmanni]
MSDINSSKRKKKPRSSKSKSSGSKSTGGTRSRDRTIKSRPSTEYRQNEEDVQYMLGNTSFHLDFSSQSDSTTRSMDFFCGTTYTAETTAAQHTLDKTFSVKSTEQDELTDETTETFAESEKVSYDNELLKIEKFTSSQSSPINNQQTVSTFIQIDAKDEKITCTLISTKYYRNADLFYKPSALLNMNITLTNDIDVRKLTPQTRRLLNRYFEEAKAVDKKISNEIVMKLSKTPKNNERIFIKDANQLYRTLCEHKFKPVFCVPTLQVLEIPTRKFIKIHIRDIRFTAHPQIYEEHRIANHLEDLYKQYVRLLNENLCEKLESELNIERKIVNNLLKRESSVSASKQRSPYTQTKPVHSLEQRLRYIKELRERLFEAEAERKDLVKEILNVWLNLKNTRKEQEYQYTRLRLRLRVEKPSDIAAEIDKWNKRFETDLSEVYREQLEKFYCAKRLYKKNDYDQSNQKPPRKPNIDKVTMELRKIYAKSFNGPEEPKITILQSFLSDEEFYEISPQHTKLKSYSIKIFFDEEFVGETRTYRLEPDLNLQINEAIGILVERRLPKDIKISLYEKTRLAPSKKLASVTNSFLTFFTKSKQKETSTQYFEFSSLKQPIAGRISLNFQCDEEQHSQDLIIPLKYNAEVRKDLTKVCSDKECSESDEGNEKEQESEQKNNVTTCTFEETILQFCSIDEIENNPRFRLLHSRYLKNDSRTKDLHLVPSLDNELEFDWEAQNENVIEHGNWMDAIDLFKHRGKKYLRNLYTAIDNQCSRLTKLMENAENPLIGDEPATWSGFFRAISLIFNPKRPLNPIRTDVPISTTVPLTADASQNFKIILNVVRATGIPIRSDLLYNLDSRELSTNSSTHLFVTQNLKYSNVRPFITLSYKDKFCRSLTAEGSNPTWNEQLILQASGNLSDQRDDIKISLFDELIEQHTNDDPLSVRHMDMYQRIQTNWLGEYRIPIHALLTNKKFEGGCELNTPKILLGYKRPSLENITTLNDTSLTIDQYPEIKENIRLWFYISIEPVFHLPQIRTFCLECVELVEVRQFLHECGLQMKELQLPRFIEPLICSADGKLMCITRLLEPIPLPVTESQNLLESICRFVSLLSTLKCNDAYMSFKGVWLSNQLLLDSTWGSTKDLGVLLCNYFLTIGIKCWLVLGLANPYGESTFVLYRLDEGDLMLADPCTGKRYYVKDVFCPLYKINFVINQKNIYFNIQSETRVSMTNFNFNDSSCWFTLFNKKNPAPLGGVQQLNYKYIDTFNTVELRKNIERKIIKKINSWRTVHKTIWNRGFQNRLYAILQQLEQEVTFGNNSYNDSHQTEHLFSDIPNHRIYGFTLNFSYTNLASISDRIKSTCIHLNTDRDVEFSLAVHIHAYSNNVLSIWVFLISITPLS